VTTESANTAGDAVRAGVTQTAEATDRGRVWQAGRDMITHNHAVTPAPPGPGLASVAVPAELMDHTIRGRDRLLAELTDLVKSGGQVVVLHGAGGYGKTTVAAALAHAVRGPGPDAMRVWWVDATTTNSLIEGLREVAVTAGAPAEEVRAAWSGQASAPDLLWRTLEGVGERWLLVLDNADDTQVLAVDGQRPASGRSWLRTHQSGTVLVTSRDGRPGVWRSAVLSPVVPLDLADGAAVLRELAPAAGGEQEARDLAETLGGLPLALWLAGRYLEATSRAPQLPGMDQPRTFADYATAVSNRFVDVVDTGIPGTELRERELLTRTWELSLDLLAAKGQPLARPVLRLLSFLAPTPIPCMLLNATVLAQCPLFDGVAAQQLSTVLWDLSGLGLVEYYRTDPGTGGLDVVVLHPLVRQTTRHQADAIEQAGIYQVALLALLDTATADLGYEDPTVWPLWRLLSPHCAPGQLPAASELGQDEDHVVALARVHHRAADFFDETGSSVQALDSYQRALAIRSRVLGADHLSTLTTRHNLAHALRERGDLDAAEAEFRDVLAIRQRVAGPDHSNTLTTRYNLALVLRERGDLAAAEAELRDVLTIESRVLGADHPSTLTTRHNLAHVLQERGDLDAAEAEFRDILTIRQRVAGPYHPSTLTTRYSLALVLQERGDLDAAEAELRDILTIRQRELGSDHPSTLTTRYNLAGVLQERGDLAAAEAELRDVLTSESRVLGADHLNTLAARHNLAHVLQERGDLAAAEAEFRDILTIESRVLSADHPSTLTTRHNLALVLQERGDLAAAEAEFRDVLTIESRVLGADHPSTLTTRQNLAGVLQERGDLDAAEAELRDVLAIRQRVLSADHPSTLSTRHNLTELQQSRKSLN
jgi:tetratricopeptide (TPR) repeat protein